jgi:hypothetical protein
MAFKLAITDSAENRITNRGNFSEEKLTECGPLKVGGVSLYGVYCVNKLMRAFLLLYNHMDLV